VKVEIGLAKGKKAHDKRASLMEKQADREIEREMSRNISGKSSNRAPSRGKYSDYDD
jgi:SsrA-binding protein